MKKAIILLISIVFSLNLFAQDKVSVEKSQFKINILLPGVSYEYGFNDKNTIYSELSVGVGYSKNSYLGSQWSFYPNISEQFRHYYNLDKRNTKGKVISKNSGGFVAVNAIYYFKALSSRDNYNENNASFVLAPIWGFQRTYKKNLNIGVNAGLGYSFEKNNNNIVPVANFTLGWVIGK